MKFNPDIHRRRTIRLKGYDYSQAGAYFVTICVHDRECLFGEIVDGEMRMNQFGHIVAAEWLRTAELRAEIALGEFVVMPNHFHGIVLITDESYNGECFGDGEHCRGTARRAPTVEKFGETGCRFIADNYTFIQISRHQTYQRNSQISGRTGMAAKLS
jgi:hypothetical protein